MITTYTGETIKVEKDPKICEEICGFKPDDIVEKEGFLQFRIAGIARGVDDGCAGAKESNKDVAWGWLYGDKKWKVTYFYTPEAGANLNDMGFVFMGTFQDHLDGFI